MAPPVWLLAYAQPWTVGTDPEDEEAETDDDGEEGIDFDGGELDPDVEPTDVRGGRTRSGSEN